MNVRLKIPRGKERVAEPAEEDLHPRLHEDAFRPLARAVQLDEAIEEGLERLRGGQADVPGPDLGLQATRLALDLVAELGRQTLEVPRVRTGQGEEGRDPVLIVEDLGREPLRRSRLDEQAEPRLVLREAAEIGLDPVVRPRERREQFLRDGGSSLGQPDRSHVVGHLGPAEEPQRPLQAFERDRADLVPVLLGEREQEVVGQVGELLPVELEEGGRVEDGAGRVGRDERRPVTPGEVPRVLAEDDVHHRCVPGARRRPRGRPYQEPPPPPPPPPPAPTPPPKPPKPLEPDPAGVDAIVPLVVTENESMLSANCA